ncbi:Protein CBG22903 [Caenorhabditis briggsae]|uniref:Protein CBG22903 n=1 Tax=Caenorhabditis briggsae TaxID=6238 RepID=A8Y3B7_CAEBR|nr:Protein CBG22903 [Caenorhabditis briggsae]CAP39386.2 Protein CBG22903 [Caenorhabditis briggsae]
MDSLDFSQQIIAIISFLINVVMIILIVSKSPKSLGAYKYLMILMSISELAYSIIDFLIKPHVISSENFWIVGTNFERSRISLDVVYPLILFWGAAYGIAVACFGIHFIFRYFMVIGIRKWVSGYLMVSIWFSIPVISGSIYAFTIHLFLSFDENLERLTFSLFTMIYFAVKVHKAIRNLTKSAENLSSIAQTLQKQLYYSLLVQTIIPMILIHFPTTVIVLAAFFGEGRPFFGDFITMTISLFPLIDPLPSMVIIKPYREAIRDSVFFWRPRRAVEPDTTKFSNVISRAVMN